MSQTSVKDFVDEVRANPKMQHRLGEPTDMDGLAARIVELGAEHGHSFAPDAVRAELVALTSSTSASGELTEDELDGVSGGFWGGVIKRLFGER